MLLSSLFVFGALLAASSVSGNPLDSDSHMLSNLNMASLAKLAHDIPYLNNASVYELFRASEAILNGTDADSVLFDLTYKSGNETRSPYQVLAVSSNNSIQQDLMNRFRIYFVNVTEHPSQSPAGWYIDATTSEQAANFSQQYRPTLWQITKNFFKNQVNAITGAFMSPFKVGAKAMVASSMEHAQAVASGSAYAYSYAHPILMRTIGLPNSVAQYAVNVSSSYDDRVQAYGQSLQSSSDAAVEGAAQSIEYGVENAHRLAVDYVAKPTAAFVGTNLALVGSGMSSIGSGMSNGAIHLSIFGSRLSAAGDSAVSTGSSAIVWALDPSVVLPGEHHEKPRLPEAKTSSAPKAEGNGRA